ncbi:MAG: hypothetical protein ABIJ08_03365 [Nanoarchaeota archaeon]
MEDQVQVYIAGSTSAAIQAMFAQLSEMQASRVDTSDLFHDLGEPSSFGPMSIGHDDIISKQGGPEDRLRGDRFEYMFKDNPDPVLGGRSVDKPGKEPIADIISIIGDPTQLINLFPDMPTIDHLGITSFGSNDGAPTDIGALSNQYLLPTLRVPERLETRLEASPTTSIRRSHFTPDHRVEKGFELDESVVYHLVQDGLLAITFVHPVGYRQIGPQVEGKGYDNYHLANGNLPLADVIKNAEEVARAAGVSQIFVRPNQPGIQPINKSVVDGATIADVQENYTVGLITFFTPEK